MRAGRQGEYCQHGDAENVEVLAQCLAMWAVSTEKPAIDLWTNKHSAQKPMAVPHLHAGKVPTPRSSDLVTTLFAESTVSKCRIDSLE